MTNNILITTWNDISQTESKGFYKRLLYNPNQVIYVYATVKLPEKNYGIAISYNSFQNLDLSAFSNLRELSIKESYDTTFEGKTTLYITLLQSFNHDIFSILCCDLINKISVERTESTMMNIMLKQLDKWQTLFDKFRLGGLSIIEQQGLYGELSFLQKFIQNNQNTFRVINSWVGVDKEVRDFQYNDWAVEVKTSSGNNHQKVHISSERQLDNTHIEHLYLYHLAVEASKGNGESLNDKINLLRDLLKNTPSALNIFNNKLIEAGYFDLHADAYNERCYVKKDENFYEVKDDFPRIKESDIKSGLEDVKYSILLSQCYQYLITEIQLFNTIKI